jgi:THO complex subunit 2
MLVVPDSKRGPRLLELLSKCAQQQVVETKLLMERVQPGTLHASGLIELKPKDFDKQKNRIRTAMYYKQQKYNLFREESEGYAKLLTELNFNRTSDSTSSKTVIRNVQALVGHFALDPNRVLSEIIGAFENSNPLASGRSQDLFVELLRNYKTGPVSISNLLGFRFKAARGGGDGDGEINGGGSGNDDDQSVTPESLYNVTAVMIREHIVTLEQVFPHLSPSSEDIRAQFVAGVAAAKAKVAKKLPDEEKEALREKTIEDDTRAGLCNQKLWLCHAALNCGDWDTAHMIMAQLPPFFAVTWPPLRKLLCGLVQAIIEPLYRTVAAPQIAKTPKAGKLGDAAAGMLCKTFLELPTVAIPMLNRLGMFAYTDVVLMTKIIRIVKAHYSQFKATPFPLQPEIERLFERVLLPAFSLIDPGNPALMDEAWAVLKMFSYETRFRLYSFWKNKSRGLHPDAMLAQKYARKEMSYFMKRLSKENVRPIGRKLGKISHSNPGPVFDQIFDTLQIVGYNNLVEPTIEAMKYLTPLSKDVVAYCVIESISNPKKERLKKGDVKLGEWLQTLAMFCASLFRKFDIELTAVIQCVTLVIFAACLR